MRSHRTLYFSALVLVATMVACTGFDVPKWTRPAGESIESTEPEDDGPSLTSDDEETGVPEEDAPEEDAPPPMATPDAGSSEAPEAGDAAPGDAGPG